MGRDSCLTTRSCHPPALRHLLLKYQKTAPQRVDYKVGLALERYCSAVCLDPQISTSASSYPVLCWICFCWSLGSGADQHRHDCPHPTRMDLWALEYLSS